jgi:hypothetical protein
LSVLILFTPQRIEARALTLIRILISWQGERDHALFCDGSFHGQSAPLLEQGLLDSKPQFQLLLLYVVHSANKFLKEIPQTANLWAFIICNIYRPSANVALCRFAICYWPTQDFFKFE